MILRVSCSETRGGEVFKMWKMGSWCGVKSVKAYILKLHRQSPDEVVCPGLLGFLENRKRESIYTILH